MLYQRDLYGHLPRHDLLGVAFCCLPDQRWKDPRKHASTAPLSSARKGLEAAIAACMTRQFMVSRYHGVPTGVPCLPLGPSHCLANQPAVG